MFLSSIWSKNTCSSKMLMKLNFLFADFASKATTCWTMKRHHGLVIFMILLLSQEALCGWVTQKNTCYDGADLYYVTTSSASKCRKACQADSECYIYTWIKFGSEKRLCYLKSQYGWVEKPESTCESGRYFPWGSIIQKVLTSFCCFNNNLLVFM